MPERLFVSLVVDQEEALILGEPPLMRVRAAAVSRPRQLHLFELVGGIDDGERVLVRVEADLAATINGVWPGIDDALCLVRVAVQAEAAGRAWRSRRAHIDHVQPAFAGDRKSVV